MKKLAGLSLFSCFCFGLLLIGCGSGVPTQPAAILAINPSALTFTSTVGQITAAQSVTLTNSGNAAATLSTATLSGANAADFAVSLNTCGSSLGMSSSCTISVTFTPSATGTRNATLNVTNLLSVALSGTGVSVASVSVLPLSLTFAATVVGQTATAQTITVSNTGGTAASLGTPALTGTSSASFAISANTCTTTLAANSTCAISVTFTPSAPGTSTASLTLSESSLGVANTFPVSLTGSALPANVTVTPSSLPFPATLVGQTATAKTITVSNTGGAAATLNTPSLSGTNAADFAISSNTCTTTLAANTSCTISVTFTPSAPGSEGATLTLNESSFGSSNTFPVSLSGNAPSANVSVTPASLLFPSTLVGQTATAQSITVSNTGGAAATLSTPSLSGANSADFAISSNTCTTTLAANASCTISVTFTPSVPGSESATLTLNESSFGSSNTFPISLSGSATPADVTLTPSALIFSSTAINQTATSQLLTLANTGGASATIATPTLTGTAAIDFAIASTTCGTTLASNASCTYSITFTPTATGTRSATFSVDESSFGTTNTFTSTLTGTGAAAALGLEGNVTTGTSPVSNSTIQLYTVGATGNDTAATAMLSGTVTTNAAGNFYLASGSPLTLNFTCANPTDQVYIVASGGNPGLASGTNNYLLTMATALGNCGSLTTTSTITINPLTTVAVAWTLAQFTGSVDYIGASSTNAAGIRNAMLDAQLLVNSSTGTIASIASNLSIEPGKLAALADALVPCANSDATTAACASLAAAANFANSPTPLRKTFYAALSIVKSPAQNVADVYALIGSNPPYPTTLTQAPNDWTLNMAVSGGALTSPTGLAIDSNGNVWAAGYFGILSGFTPQGTPLSSTGYGTGKLNEVYGLTIDSNGNIWASDQVGPTNGTGSVTKFTPSGVGTFSAIQPYFDSSISYPVAVAADTNGDIFIANYATSAVTAYTSAGAPLASHGTGLGSGSALGPVAVAADANHGVWIANSQTSTVTHVSSTGAIISNLACCAGTNGSNGIATDSAGNAWISDFGASAYSVISTGGTGDAIVINEQPLLGSGLTAGPAGVAVDAAQNVFFANFRGQSISEIAGTQGFLGTLLSPPTGFGYPSPSTATPRVLAPEAIVPDASGNLWVTNNGNNNLVVFFGLAAPTKTPVMPTPIAP